MTRTPSPKPVIATAVILLLLGAGAGMFWWRMPETAALPPTLALSDLYRVALKDAFLNEAELRISGVEMTSSRGQIGMSAAPLAPTNVTQPRPDPTPTSLGAIRTYPLDSLPDSPPPKRIAFAQARQQEWNEALIARLRREGFLKPSRDPLHQTNTIVVAFLLEAETPRPDGTVLLRSGWQAQVPTRLESDGRTLATVTVPRQVRAVRVRVVDAEAALGLLLEQALQDFLENYRAQQSRR
jgi:hypothetical protein